MLASGYVIDAIPKGKRLEIILNGWRKVEVKTTYPVYVITESPDTITQTSLSEVISGRILVGWK